MHFSKVLFYFKNNNINVIAIDARVATYTYHPLLRFNIGKFSIGGLDKYIKFTFSFDPLRILLIHNEQTASIPRKPKFLKNVFLHISYHNSLKYPQ